jgi:ethanolamine transporter EutH
VEDFTFNSIILLIPATLGIIKTYDTHILRVGYLTRDILIPDSAIVTKLKSGNKTEAQKSILKLQAICNGETTIYPGHGNPIKAVDVNWNFYL